MRILQNRMVHEIVPIFHAQRDQQIRLYSVVVLIQELLMTQKDLKRSLIILKH